MKTRKNHLKLTLPLLAGVLFAGPFASQAATLNYAGTGSTTLPGNGTWDTTTLNQWNSGAGAGNAVWTNPSDALFGGADGTYAVTVAAPVNVTKFMRFDFNGYTLSAATPQTVTINSSGSGTVGAGNANIELASGKTATIGNKVTVQSNNTTLIIGGTTTANAGSLVIASGGVLQQAGAGTTPGTTGLVGVGTTVTVQSGGALNVSTTGVAVTAGSNFLMGSNNNDNVTLNVAGTLTYNPLGGQLSSGFSIFKVSGNGANANTVTGTVNINGGTLTMAGGNAGNTMALTYGSAGNGTINLNSGGTLAVTKIVQTGTNGSAGGTGTVNLNGGTLKPTDATAAATFLTGLTGASRVNVRDGGAIVDTSGINTTIGQALLHSNIGTNNPNTGTPDGSIDGGLTKLGAGTLTLSGTSTYTGPTVITAGTLKLNASGLINSTSGVTLNGGTLDINNISQTLAALTLSTSSFVDFGATTANILTFGNSSALTWAGLILTLQNFDKNVDALNFGVGGLAGSSQWSKIQYVDGGSILWQGSGLDGAGNVTFTAVPEPSAVGLLMGLGLMVIVFLKARRRRLA